MIDIHYYWHIYYYCEVCGNECLKYTVGHTEDNTPWIGLVCKTETCERYNVTYMMDGAGKVTKLSDD